MVNCKTCKFISSNLSVLIIHGRPICRHPKLYITGEDKKTIINNDKLDNSYMPSIACEKLRSDEQHCGPNAKWYEKRRKLKYKYNYGK